MNFDGEPLNWKEGIDEIDWDLMAKRDYLNHECKEACMAEALFEGQISPKSFHCLYVRTEEVKSKILIILEKTELLLNVNVIKSFFTKKDD